MEKRMNENIKGDISLEAEKHCLEFDLAEVKQQNVELKAQNEELNKAALRMTAALNTIENILHLTGGK